MLREDGGAGKPPEARVGEQAPIVPDAPRPPPSSASVHPLGRQLGSWTVERAEPAARGNGAGAPLCGV